jgi:hypothetical protein
LYCAAPRPPHLLFTDRLVHFQTAQPLGDGGVGVYRERRIRRGEVVRAMRLRNRNGGEREGPIDRSDRVGVGVVV